MPFDPLTAAIDLATSIGGKLADRFLPASMSEADKAKAQIEAQKIIIEEMKVEGGIIESINATMREESKSEYFIQYAWRPLVGLTFVGVIINNYILIPYAQAFGLNIQVLSIPDGIWQSMLVILGVAAGTRGYEKIVKAGK